MYVDNLFTKAQFSEHGKSIASLTNMVLGLLEEVDQYDYDKWNELKIDKLRKLMVI